MVMVLIKTFRGGKNTQNKNESILNDVQNWRKLAWVFYKHCPAMLLSLRTEVATLPSRVRSSNTVNATKPRITQGAGSTKRSKAEFWPSRAHSLMCKVIDYYT